MTTFEHGNADRRMPVVVGLTPSSGEPDTPLARRLMPSRRDLVGEIGSTATNTRSTF
jgi:hypothetical protein